MRDSRLGAPLTVTGTMLEPGAPVVLFSTRLAVRRHPRRALSHQHGTGQRPRADHAADELEPRGEEVSARTIGPALSLAFWSLAFWSRNVE
jgi:hypothetical protein